MPPSGCSALHEVDPNLKKKKKFEKLWKVGNTCFNMVFLKGIAEVAEAYLGPCYASMKKLFMKIVNLLLIPWLPKQKNSQQNKELAAK